MNYHGCNTVTDMAATSMAAAAATTTNRHYVFASSTNPTMAVTIIIARSFNSVS